VIYVGMSGFSYPEWIGDVYPAGTKREGMLAEYAKIFNAVEINMSFRRTPEGSTIDRWRESVPEAFRFTMKANQRITHWRRLVDVGEDISELTERFGRMGERLGTLLFQVPATLKFDRALIASFGASLRPGYTYAFEPRDPSFLTDEATKALRTHEIALCLNDDLFDPAAYATTGPVAYFRFHRDSYSAEDLSERAALVGKLSTEGVDVYAFFQHEDNPESVRPALAFRDLVAG
jgi:uncharacterized protein YecE (DUF72 family)